MLDKKKLIHVQTNYYYYHRQSMQYNDENIVMVIIKNLQINQIPALNNP